MGGYIFQFMNNAGIMQNKLISKYEYKFTNIGEDNSADFFWYRFAVEFENILSKTAKVVIILEYQILY